MTTTENEIIKETRHYVDAILSTFTYPRKINNIHGEIENVLKSENGDTTKENIWRIYVLVRGFLSNNGFGHSEDYVFLIDEKGMILKECGSLRAFEEKFGMLN